MRKTALQTTFAPAKRLLPSVVWSPIRAIATAVITPLRFSFTTGHWKSSLQMEARGASGEPIPWYTYPAIDFLSQRNFEGRNILEFGGGQSTLWWSKRARSVLTIEEDAHWSALLRDRVDDNVSVHHVPIDPQTRSVDAVRSVLDTATFSQFDIIVVDGHLREELTALAFDYLAPGGAIIIDDAEGYGIHDRLKSQQCSRIDFFGFAPGVVMRHCTALVYCGNSFLVAPNIPISDIESTAGRAR